MTRNRIVVELIYILCYSAVNIYAMITGYLSINIKKRNLSRILELWIQTLFYSVILTLGLSQFAGGLNLQAVLYSFFPIITRRWWYLTCYFAIWFFIPYINRMLNTLKQKEYIELLVCIFIICSVAGSIGQVFGKDIINVNSGCSPIWLILMYIFGAYIRKWPINVKCGFMVVSYLISSLFIWVFWLFVSGFTIRVFGEPKGQNLLISYISPPVLVSAISLFMFGLRLHKKSRIIELFSKCSLGIYLISEHPYVRELFVNDKLTKYMDASILNSVFAILGYAFLLFCICMTISILQYKLFCFLKGKRLILG